MTSLPEEVLDGIEAVAYSLHNTKHDHTRAGRLIIDGDFRTVKIPEKPTVIVGNPPFKADLLNEFLQRSHKLLDEGQQVGFLLSVHLLQTPSAVIRWNENWSMSQNLVPRTLFPKAIRPLSFVIFTKDKQRQLLGGFSLYHEAHDVQGMPPKIKAILKHVGEQPTWKRVVVSTLTELGGKATVKEIYAAVEPKRPSGNPWWQSKVRQTLQRYCESTERGVWAVPQRG